MTIKKPLSKPLIFIGMGGHCGVLLDMAKILGIEILGAVDSKDAGEIGAKKFSIPYLGHDNVILNYTRDDICLVNAIGSSSNMENRDKIFKLWHLKNYEFATLIHPSATISPTAKLGEGCQVMAGAIIQPYTQISANCIINSNSSIDHDSIIGESCHVSPGVIMSGGVNIGARSHIGTGAKIIQGINIGDDSLVAAGAVVIRNAPARSRLIGVPAVNCPPK